MQSEALTRISDLLKSCLAALISRAPVGSASVGAETSLTGGKLEDSGVDS